MEAKKQKERKHATKPKDRNLEWKHEAETASTKRPPTRSRDHENETESETGSDREDVVMDYDQMKCRDNDIGWK